MMDIPKLLDLAVGLEIEISKLYELIAEHSGDAPVATRLKAIAQEEINHANTIRIGIKYYEELPDLFSGVTIDEPELRTGLEETRAFRESLGSGKTKLPDNLKKLLEFERRYERVHMGVSIRATEPSLKMLFANLSKGDRSHIAVLKILIESLGVGI